MDNVAHLPNIWNHEDEWYVQLPGELSVPINTKKFAEEYVALIVAYRDLIMQVGKKFPGESRHDTAKRYIQLADRNDSGPCMETKP